MDAPEALEALVAGHCHFDDLQAPRQPGIYGFFLVIDDLRGVSQPGDSPLYVGLSSNLAQREYETHFAADQSGFSTLRRSLGALLKDDLDLKPQPRGTGASYNNFRNYRFDDAGETALSAWMRDHLEVGVVGVAEPRSLEKDLIALACPPLNLTGWSNPSGPAVKAARKACVELARQAAPR